MLVSLEEDKILAVYKKNISPQCARRCEENAATSACASRKAANSIVLPTNSLAKLLMMAKWEKNFIKLAWSSSVRSMRSHSN